MADSSEGFDEYLENVLRILDGKGFKIRLKSEQKKAIKQLPACTKGNICWQYILNCKLLIKWRNEKYQYVTAGAALSQRFPTPSAATQAKQW